jgi:DeoR/GlpR family transcriptional regulator of sugar metabolism
MTIHRDLDELQRRGSLRKVRGGASVLRTTQLEYELRVRLGTMVAEKQSIAEAAVKLIRDGDVVLIDDSTTALEMVPLLGRFEELTVITNFRAAMDQLSEFPSIQLIFLGGQYDQRYGSFVGVICEENIARLWADVVFVSTSSLSGTTLYHQDQLEVGTKRAMIGQANRRVLLLDHSKIGQRALYRLCDIKEFDHMVVDSGTSADDIRMIEEQGVKVTVA